MTTRVPLPELIGRSAALAALREQIRRLARISHGGRLPPILILGETGSGKGLVAGLLHRSGRRGAGPFIDVNCAAIPETLLESELFGFERGAFTDARAPKQGLIEAAHHGTLFLDEIGELPDALQVKLLTAIESHQVRRLGRTRNEPVDVWIIAATSTDLSAAMHARRFRRELYHRLSTVVLELPPLRTRGRDILDLAEHFLARAATDHGLPAKRLTEDARAALLAYRWPGNVRELANVLERVVLLEDSPVITASMLSLSAPDDGGARESAAASLRSAEAHRADERQELVTALNAARGNITRAAARLGIHRNTMRYRLSKHELMTRGAAPGDGAVQREASPVLSAPVPARAIRWEERLVAVLGTEVASSTEGSAFEFEPASAMPELIEKITSFGARIEQFTPSELVAVFGIEPMEDAARRAVLAAQAMLQALRRSQDGRHGRFAIHLGSYLIARAGAVVGMDALARHHAAVILHDLLRQAAPGEIVVDAAAARFLERHFALETLGGPAAPARIVGRERPRFEMGGRTLSRFVGRARDLEALFGSMTRAEAGEAQIVGLVGEPGVGKSRLLFELIHSDRVKGWTVLEAVAVPYGQATSYLPVAGLLRGYFHISDRETPQEIREKVTGKVVTLDRSLESTLSALLAVLEVTVEDQHWQRLDPALRRRRTLEAVKRLLLRQTQVQPLLVIFEDLHWIDSETQAVLDTLVGSMSKTRLLLLTSYRPEYRPPWGNRTDYTERRLDPLEPESANDLLAALLGRHASLDPLKPLLADRTGRNPLFIEEVVRTLVEAQSLAGEVGAYRLIQPVETIQVPPTVQTILTSRIDRLPAEDARLLETAAVIGQAVPFRLLQAITGEDGEALERGLNRLKAAEFLYEGRRFPDPEYTFKHALTQEVAYGGVPQDRRRALHARIVGAIELLHARRLTEHLERLGHHALRGEMWGKAVHYLRQAGLKAAARSALQDARVWFEQALAVLETRPEGPATLEQAFEIRLELRPVLSMLGEVRIVRERLREAEILAEKLNDDLRRGRVCAFLTNINSQFGDPDEALLAGTRALEIAERLADSRLRILTTTYLELTHYYRGEYDKVVELATDNLAALPVEWIYEDFGAAQPVSIWDRYWLVGALAQLGRFTEAASYAAEAIRLAEPTQHANTIGQARLSAVALQVLKGDWLAACSLIEHWVAGLRTVEVFILLPAVISASSLVLAQLGDAIEALNRLREGERLVEKLSSRGVVGQCSAVYHALGRAALLLGRLHEARRLGERALEYAPAHPGYAAHAWHLLGDIASHPDQFDAELGKARYVKALALAEPRGMRPLVAHCHLSLGRLYRGAGKRQEAHEHLGTATAMYREIDMAYWLEQAEVELRRAE